MIIPVRCFTCGKVIAHLLEPYLDELQKNLKEGEDYFATENNFNSEKTIEGKTLDKLKLERICCRSHFLCYKDFSKDIST